MEKALQKNERKAQHPVEGTWFMVEPATINHELFYEERKDSRQEWTRKMIFKVLKKNEYVRSFETMIPEKAWERGRNVKQLKEIAKKVGGQIATFDEQVLEWAQRISNGETWEEVCNKPDTSKWYRLVLERNGSTILVGACHEFNISNSSTDFLPFVGNIENPLSYVVPLVVRYK